MASMTMTHTRAGAWAFKACPAANRVCRVPGAASLASLARSARRQQQAVLRWVAQCARGELVALPGAQGSL